MPRIVNYLRDGWVEIDPENGGNPFKAPIDTYRRFAPAPSMEEGEPRFVDEPSVEPVTGTDEVTELTNAMLQRPPVDEPVVPEIRVGGPTITQGEPSPPPSMVEGEPRLLGPDVESVTNRPQDSSIPIGQLPPSLGHPLETQPQTGSAPVAPGGAVEPMAPAATPLPTGPIRGEQDLAARFGSLADRRVANALERGEKQRQAALDQRNVLDQQLAYQQKWNDEQAQRRVDEMKEKQRLYDESKALWKKYNETKLDAGRWFKSKSTEEQIGIAIGAIASSVAAAFSRNPAVRANPGVKLLIGALDRDIKLQVEGLNQQLKGKAMHDGIVAHYYRMTGDVEKSALLARSSVLDMYKTKLQRAAVNANSELARVNASDAALKIETELTNTLNQAYQSKKARDLQAWSIASANKRADDRLKWDKEKFERQQQALAAKQTAVLDKLGRQQLVNPFSGATYTVVADPKRHQRLADTTTAHKQVVSGLYDFGKRAAECKAIYDGPGSKFLESQCGADLRRMALELARKKLKMSRERPTDDDIKQLLDRTFKIRTWSQNFASWNPVKMAADMIKEADRDLVDELVTQGAIRKKQVRDKGGKVSYRYTGYTPDGREKDVTATLPVGYYGNLLSSYQKEGRGEKERSLKQIDESLRSPVYRLPDGSVKEKKIEARIRDIRDLKEQYYTANHSVGKWSSNEARLRAGVEKFDKLIEDATWANNTWRSSEIHTYDDAQQKEIFAVGSMLPTLIAERAELQGQLDALNKAQSVGKLEH